MMTLTHIDLFSGIGGFALAARWAGLETVQFVEIDPFCQKVLRKHWPEVPIHNDITTFAYAESGKSREQAESKRGEDIGRGNCEATTYAYRDGLQESGAKQQTDRMRQYVQSEQSRPFLLTGGFPCQPFSCAGKRRGKDDDRYLWPEMLRVISEARPTWVIGENVAGFINMGLDDSISDLEREGYEVQAFVIPACAKNAPHRRDRVWIVAHSTSVTSGGLPIGEVTQNSGPCCSDSHAPDTDGMRRCGGWGKNGCQVEQARILPGEQAGGKVGSENQGCGSVINQWDKPWLEAATRLCTLDDGLPGGLVRPKGWRVNALKAAGNAIVPQIAYEIIKAIVAVERGK